jgi:Cu-processing system permease protein
MIEITNVSKHFGRRAALDGVSITLVPGVVTLLLGRNGAGKSTLLRCILGITGFSGRIDVEGLDPIAQGRDVRAQVGYMPQSGGLHDDLTVRETIAFHSAIRNVPVDRTAMLIADAGLDAHEHATVGELSGGLQQRLAFVVAIMTDPSILLLDEPSASLDDASRQWLAGRLRDLAAGGRTVIVSTHTGEDFGTGVRRILLQDGRIIADSGHTNASVAGTKREPQACRKQAAVGPIVKKELKDAIRNRWLIGYAALLAVLGIVSASAGISTSGGLALQVFGRTTATLMNLCLLLAPLVAVAMGAAAIAGERDRGTLECLLAQPLTRTGLLLGKYAGLLLALAAATLAGFLPAGLLVAWSSGAATLGHYLLFPGLAAAVGAAMLAVGVLVSVSSRTAVQAQGTALFSWFAFVLLYDLVLMGAVSFSGLGAPVLAALLVGNPIDAARVLSVLGLEPDLYLLGPAGAYLTSRFSAAGTAVLLTGSLMAWTASPLTVAIGRFRLRPAPLPRATSATSMASWIRGRLTRVSEVSSS